MLEIIPGILEKDWNEIERKIEIAKSFAKEIHIDIIDGKFSPNTTFLDPLPFKKFTHSTGSGQALFFELHMMVENPIKYLKPFADVGFKRFLGHIEKMPDQTEFVAKAQLLGEVGLALDLETPLDYIQVPFDDLDVLFFMTTQAGSSGQGFSSVALPKIQLARSKTAIPIEVDGGINDETIILAKHAGANRFVSTTFIFNSSDPQKQYEILKQVQDDKE